MIDATREVRPRIEEREIRRYRHVRLTLVYELRVTYPFRWKEEAREALDRLTARGRPAVRPKAVKGSSDRKRSPTSSVRRGQSIDRPPAATPSLIEMRAAGVRPR